MSSYAPQSLLSSKFKKKTGTDKPVDNHFEKFRMPGEHF
jgi:hypothetical protein